MSSTEKISRRAGRPGDGQGSGGRGQPQCIVVSRRRGRDLKRGAPPPAATPRRTPDEKLRIATCQFPVGANARGECEVYPGIHARGGRRGSALCCTRRKPACPDTPEPISRHSRSTTGTRCARRPPNCERLAKELKMWLVLGSAHFLDENTKPTNCLYLIDPEGKIVDRYDKCFCTAGDQKHYSAGNRLVTHEIRGVKVGLAICYDICWPQLYIAYRKMGVTVMIHSMYNADDKGRTVWTRSTIREVPTRCADNRMWASSQQFLAALFPLGIVYRPARCHHRQSSCRSISPACWFTTFPTPCRRRVVSQSPTDGNGREYDHDLGDAQRSSAPTQWPKRAIGRRGENCALDVGMKRSGTSA